MAEQLDETIERVHAALFLPIQFLIDTGAHTPLTTEQYCRQELRRSEELRTTPHRATSAVLERRRAQSGRPSRPIPSQSLPSTNSNRAPVVKLDGFVDCNFGQLLDIKAVFDNFNVFDHNTLRSFSTKKMVSRAHSAPVEQKVRPVATSLALLTLGHTAAQSDARIAKEGSIPERNFVELLGPTLCGSFPKDVLAWYSSVDTNGTGQVTWAKFSRYLQQSIECHRMASKNDELLATCLRYNDVPLDPTLRSPHFRVTRVCDGGRGAFFILCTDGCVREVCKKTLKVTDVVHYSEESGEPHPVDVRWSAERNQLFVALPTGFVYVYDTTGHLSRQGNILKAYRIGPALSYDVKGWNHTGGTAPMVKTVKFDPLHMEWPDNGQRLQEIPRFLRSTIDVIPLSQHPGCRCGGSNGLCLCPPLTLRDANISSIEPYQEVQGSKDPIFFVGFDNGHVALYKPPMVQPVVSGSRKASIIVRPFESRVTCMKHCDTFSDLRGLLSSSSDGDLSLIDIETCEVVMTFRDARDSSEVAATDGGGWLNGTRPVSRFDVSRKSPLIASCGHMRGVSLWSATMRRKVASFHDHRGPIMGMCFNCHTNHLLTTGADRTIRVYDIRMMRAVQVIIDRERPDTLTYSDISYDESYRRVVAWTGAPYVYTLKDESSAAVASAAAQAGPQSQEEPTAEVEVGQLPSTSNLDPVSFVLSCTKNEVDYFLQASGCSLTLWHCSTGSIETMLTANLPIVAVALDALGLKAYVGLDDGTVAQYVIGAQSFSREMRLRSTMIRSMTMLRKRTLSSEFGNAYLVVGGCRGTISLFPDRSTGGVITAHHTITIDHSCPNLAPCGDVISLAVVSDRFLLFGSSAGCIGVLSCESDGIVLRRIIKLEGLLTSMSHGVDSATLSQRSILRSDTGLRALVSRAVSAPPSHSAELWRRAVLATQREQSLNATKFTKFRYEAQEQVQVMVDSIGHLADVSGECCYFLCGFGNGDCRIAMSPLYGRIPTDGSKPIDFVACFPASSADGCAFTVLIGKPFGNDASSAFWIGDDQGVLVEYHLTIKVEQAQIGESPFVAECRDSLDTSPDRITAGPKYFYQTNLQLRIFCAWRYPCSITSLTSVGDGSGNLIIGLGNGKSSALSLDSRDAVWGVLPEPNEVELVQSHRYTKTFSHGGHAIVPRRKSLAPQYQRSLSRVAFKKSVGANDEETDEKSAGEKEAANRSKYLQIVMRKAPTQLREAVLRLEGEEEVKSLASNLRYRDREKDDALDNACFSRLRLNNVSTVFEVGK